MKVIELLSESAKDEHRIQLIAKYLIRRIRKDVEAEINFNKKLALRGQPVDDPQIELGFIKDIIPTKVLSNLFNRLGRIKIDIDYTRENKLLDATFAAATGTIELKYPNNAKTKPAELESTLVHELRHALDSSLSRGWGFDKPAKPKKFLPTSFNGKTDDYKYFAAPHEINARFSQVQIEITNLIKSKIRGGLSLTVPDFMQELYQLLNNRDLSVVFPTKDVKVNTVRQIIGSAKDTGQPLDNKDYRQLLNRAIKYFEAEKLRLNK